MILKNLKHHLKLAWNTLQVIARDDVLVEKAVTFKYPESVRFGSHCTVQSNSYIYGSRSGKQVVLGDDVVIGSHCMLMGEAGIFVGDSTHIGPSVIVTTQYGDSSSEMTRPDTQLKYEPVQIGRGCWITSGSVIMPGTVLGDRCIVAPNSVVFGRWGDGLTLSGNPARPLKSVLRK